MLLACSFISFIKDERNVPEEVNILLLLHTFTVLSLNFFGYPWSF